MGVMWLCQRCNRQREPVGLCHGCGSPEFRVVHAFREDDRVWVETTAGRQGGIVLAVSHHTEPAHMLYAVQLADGVILQVMVEQLCQA